MLIGGLLGTFARVWLVKLKTPAEEDRDKVFALKVLRKVDGEQTEVYTSQMHVMLTANIQLSSSSRSIMSTMNVLFLQMLRDTHLLLH